MKSCINTIGKGKYKNTKIVGLESRNPKYPIRGYAELRCIYIFYGAWAPRHANSQNAHRLPIQDKQKP